MSRLYIDGGEPTTAYFKIINLAALYSIILSKVSVWASRRRMETDASKSICKLHCTRLCNAAYMYLNIIHIRTYIDMVYERKPKKNIILKKINKINI